MLKKIMARFVDRRKQESEHIVDALTALWDVQREQQKEINALREQQQRLELLNNPWSYWPAGENQ